jgi:ketosteroid isomerase-like protein
MSIEDSIRDTDARFAIDSGGDVGYHVGTFAADAPTEAGSDQRVTGKFLDIYKPDADGTWKIHVTMFNFDAPVSE